MALYGIILVRRFDIIILMKVYVSLILDIQQYSDKVINVVGWVKNVAFTFE